MGPHQRGAALASIAVETAAGGDQPRRRIIFEDIRGRVAIAFRDFAYSLRNLANGSGFLRMFNVTQNFFAAKSEPEIKAPSLDKGMIESTENILARYFGTASWQRGIVVVNSLQQYGELAKQLIGVEQLRVPYKPGPTLRRSLSSSVFARHDRASNQNSTLRTIVGRAAYKNFDQMRRMEENPMRKDALEQKEVALAHEAYRRLAPKLTAIESAAQDAMAHNFRGWLSRAAKTFQMPTAANKTDQDKMDVLLRVMQQTGSTELKAKDAVAGAVQEENMVHYPVLKEVDKTQQKLKIDNVTRKMLDEAASKTVDEALYTLRSKGNQPVQSVDPAVSLMLQEMVRLVAEIIQQALLPHVVFASMPGMKPEDIFERVFGVFEKKDRPNVAFTEGDVKECDASHFRGLRIFVGLILKHVAPRCRLLRKAFLIWVGSLAAHWRSKTIHMRQVVNLFRALASGVPHTFLWNSLLILMSLASCEQEWNVAVLGGDDLAVGQLLYSKLNFGKMAPFKVNFEVPAPTIGVFAFHSRLHTPMGSFPHMIKVAGKALDRRFSPQIQTARQEIKDFRQSLYDQMRVLAQRNQTQIATGVTAKYEGVHYDVVEQCTNFIEQYVNTSVDKILNMTHLQTCIILDTEVYGPRSGVYVPPE